MRLIRLLLVVVYLILKPAIGASPAVAVIYPDIREPFRGLFLDIIDGIKQDTGGNVHEYALKRGFDISKVEQDLQGAAAIIALGSRGLSAALRLSGKRPLILGAIVALPPGLQDAMTGIMLTPDPAILFRRLKILNPDVTDVSVVYNPQRYQWLIERARAAAAVNDLQLHAYVADDIRRGARQYEAILRNHSARTEAIWLLPDSSVVDLQTTLPQALRHAWDDRMILFSSNPDLVKRGVLFAMYPDTVAMGRSLARLARQRIAHPRAGSPVLEPLRDLSIAFNTRTAEHLGLSISRAQLRRFELVFP